MFLSTGKARPVGQHRHTHSHQHHKRDHRGQEPLEAAGLLLAQCLGLDQRHHAQQRELGGTAQGIGRDVSYRIAGKTGTAQVVGIKQDEEYDVEKVKERNQDHGLFIAFAPADKPRIAIAVIVENGGGGSTSAAPVARQVLDAYLLPQLAAEAELKGNEADKTEVTLGE